MQILSRYEEKGEVLCGMKVSDVTEGNLIQATDQLNQASNLPFQKISILPPQKGLEFPGEWRLCKAKKFKKMYEAQLKFPEGWGVLEKIPSVGEIWICSGITQCYASATLLFCILNP